MAIEPLMKFRPKQGKLWLIQLIARVARQAPPRGVNLTLGVVLGNDAILAIALLRGHDHFLIQITSLIGRDAEELMYSSCSQ